MLAAKASNVSHTAVLTPSMTMVGTTHAVALQCSCTFSKAAAESRFAEVLGSESCYHKDDCRGGGDCGQPFIMMVTPDAGDC